MGDVCIEPTNGSNVISITPTIANTCCHQYSAANTPGVYQNTVLGVPGQITYYSQPTYVFDGVYHVVGDLVFQFNTITLMPGTIFYIDPGVRIIDYIGQVNLTNCTLTSTCDEMWDGLYYEGSGAYTLLMDGCTLSNSKGGLQMGFPPQDIFPGIPNLWVGTFQITNSTFHNNFYSIQLSAHDSGLGQTYIRNNTFTSDPNTMQAPYNRTATDFYYSQAAFRTLLAHPTEFTDNIISDHIYGVFAADHPGVHVPSLVNYPIARNKFTNCFGAAIIGFNDAIAYNDYYTAKIYLNEITIPTIPFTNSQVTSSDPVQGINLLNGRFLLEGNIVDKDNMGGLKTTEGFNLSTFGTLTTVSANVVANTIRNMDTGIKFSLLDNSNPKFTKNILEDNTTAFHFASNPYSLPDLEIRCNTFDNSGISGTNYGILVDNNVYCNNLGNSSVPNGNAFTGVGFPLEYKGIDPANFRYFKTASPLENIVITSGGSPLTGALQSSSGLAVCVPPAGVPTGYKLSVVEYSSEESIHATMDSLRFQLGSFQQMKAWQSTILTYHKENSKLEDLYEYTDSLNGCNMESYNTFMLYFMNQYEQNGQCSKAHECKQKLKETNVGDKEIEARVNYFEYTCRHNHGTGESSNTLSPEDSTALTQIANSGTSLSERACLTLKFYYPFITCNSNNTYVPIHVDCDSDCKKKKESFVKKNWEAKTGFNSDKKGAQLSQNIPNPASGETNIPYFIPQEGFTNAYIIIQNVINGIEVTRINLTQTGYNNATLNCEGLNSGVYSYTLVVDGVKQDMKKLIVVK